MDNLLYSLELTFEFLLVIMYNESIISSPVREIIKSNL